MTLARWIGGAVRGIIGPLDTVLRTRTRLCALARQDRSDESVCKDVRFPGANATGGRSMILQEQDDQLLVIRQTDHALLAGFFASAWGNEQFARPELVDSFCLAVREHDNGWNEWELAPAIDPKTRLPYSFMSIPTEQHVEVYRRGIERVVKADPYAGLLVSLHCAGLYDHARATMPGYSAKYVKSKEQQMVNDFLQELKLQQLRLKIGLRGNPDTKKLAEETSMERNARLLEVLDRLSLYFCLNSTDNVTIEGVPQNNEGGEVDWQLRNCGDSAFSLEPYPFRKEPLGFSILARRVPRRLYGDEVDFQRTVDKAPFFALNFTLRAGGATQSAVA